MVNFTNNFLGKQLILLLIIVMGLNSCRSNKSFSEKEKKLITKKDVTQPMRVFLITRKTDSILLRKKSKWIRFNKQTNLIKQLANRMLATVQDSASLGVGIAAPQVGVLKRMVVVQRLDKDGEPFEVYVNPIIKKYSKRKRPCPEGCLSIPGKRAITLDRAYSVWLEYQTLNGEKKQEKVTDFVSVIFQHEIDHLNGILFIDHLLKEVADSK